MTIDLEPGVDLYIGADIGGTFTDVALLTGEGDLFISKNLTTVRDYSLAIVSALAGKIDDRAAGATKRFVHGTTVATNAILQRTTNKVALVTTTGFKDVLEVRRGRRPTLYDLTWRPPAPLVPRDLRFEVLERVDFDGAVDVSLSEEDVASCIDRLQSAGVDAVAICLLNSFANPAHEIMIEESIASRLPMMMVTRSSDIDAERKEYERTSTSVVNAYLLPVIAGYLDRLEASVKKAGVLCGLEIMQSDGTTLTAQSTRTRPFLMIESGPAAGVVAAARLAEEMGLSDVITLDMGGTTAKAALIEHGVKHYAEQLDVGGTLTRGEGLLQGSGFPVRSPCIDLSEIGAGGGSIAWVDSGGGLKVGPKSAGSEPGPACYGFGATEPTVTDSYVVLGYMNPKAIAGGAQSISYDLARQAVARVAEPLGLSIEDAAYGVFQVATEHMRRSVRSVTVERGRDPRSFSMIAFGGAGALHAATLASDLRIEETIVPVAQGVFSSLGLLFSDLAATRVASIRAALSDESIAAVLDVARDLVNEAEDALALQHASVESPQISVSLAARYVGQSSSLYVPMPPELFRGANIDGLGAILAGRFHREHVRTYGHAAEEEEVEVESLQARAWHASQTPTFAQIASKYLAHMPLGTEARSERQLYFGPDSGWQAASILTRSALTTAPRKGPMVIEEPEGTTLVPPNHVAHLDATGSVVIRHS